jgi:hypothetical protein
MNGGIPGPQGVGADNVDDDKRTEIYLEDL